MASLDAGTLDLALENNLLYNGFRVLGVEQGSQVSLGGARNFALKTLAGGRLEDVKGCHQSRLKTIERQKTLCVRTPTKKEDTFSITRVDRQQILTLDNIDEGQRAVSEIRLFQVVGVVPGGALVGALGTVLGGHAGLGHDKDVGHALARLVGSFVADLFHGGDKLKVSVGWFL